MNGDGIALGLLEKAKEWKKAYSISLYVDNKEAREKLDELLDYIWRYVEVEDDGR